MGYDSWGEGYMDITSEDDISIQEARHVMEKRKEEKDLVYDQKICLEYLEKVAKLTQNQTNQLKDDLSGISILRPRHISMIMSMLPDTKEEVEMLFSKERTNLKKDEIDKIVEICRKFRK
jgi:DNA-directed RNA polymerase subunit F